MESTGQKEKGGGSQIAPK